LPPKRFFFFRILLLPNYIFLRKSSQTFSRIFLRMNCFLLQNIFF
jgi:hypothetical protein